MTVLLYIVLAGSALWLAVEIGQRLRQWRRHRLSSQRADPTVDPFGGQASSEQREALAAWLAKAEQAVGEERARCVAEALGAVHASAWGWYPRAAVRPLRSLAAQACSESKEDADAIAVWAQVLAALGHLHEAREAVERIAPDHWRGCWVRAVLYDAHGDLRRAEAALVAARELSPPGARPGLDRELRRFRQR